MLYYCVSKDCSTPIFQTSWAQSGVPYFKKHEACLSKMPAGSYTFPCISVSLAFYFLIYFLTDQAQIYVVNLKFIIVSVLIILRPIAK